MYGRATSYEKLQIVRLMYETSEMKSDAIVKKFCNETYHIENDFLFQLDPRKFDTVPAFVIERLDSLVESGLHED